MSYGTFGILIHEGEPFAVTLEPEWQNNIRNVSCIPSGTYLCKSINSHRFGQTFEVQDVPGRSHILFHKGNNKNDSLGCILVGEQIEDGRLVSSGKGFREFTGKLVSERKFQIEILDALKVSTYSLSEDSKTAVKV